MDPTRSTFPRRLAASSAGRPAHICRAVAVSVLPLLVLLASSAGCRQNMHNQNKIGKPYRESLFFADGSSARPLPANTVARGDLRADQVYYSGLHPVTKLPVDTLPFPLTRNLLLRGQERFNIFCSPCHGRVGDGNGMIVQRGYKHPTSYYEDRLRKSPVGYFFYVMTQGYGVMPSYAAQVPVADRWAIAAYIRALQLSQHATLDDVPPDQRAQLEAQ